MAPNHKLGQAWGGSIAVSFPDPFGIWPELLPSHIPLPARIPNQILSPIQVSADPERAKDDAYVDLGYGQVQERIQEAVGLMAMQRRFPILG